MLSWIVAGIEYSLDDKTITRLLGHDGLGMPALRRLSERGALQHGDFDRGYRLDPRFIVLTLGIKGTDHDDFYAKRALLVNIFKPRLIPGTLRFTRNGTVRDLNCHLAEGDGLRFSDQNREYLYQTCAVVLKANDPTWYDPDGKNRVFSLGIGSDILVIPTGVPLTVGVSTLDISQNIAYNGTVRVYPRIRVTGPIMNCVITHKQMGWKLDFTGTTIGAGGWFDIDLRYGHKTVIDHNDANQIGALTNDSDLAEFCLLPAPDVGGGTNTIRVVGSAVDPATAVSMKYYERYIGL